MVDFKEDERLNTLNHSCAHVMAQAVKHLYPNAKFWVGPVVKEGFYYDIDLGDTAVNDDVIAAIEKEMKKVCKEGKKIYRREISKAEALELFKDDEYKLDLIDGLEDGNISVYDQGDFTDLCRGPHVDNTKLCKNFKLIKYSGVYWKGDANNHVMQRIYGVCFPTAEELEEHLKLLEEAKDRDHRKIGKEMHLFMSDDLVGRGLPMFLPKGYTVWQELENYIKAKERKLGYLHVMTPCVGTVNLYKTSGHWDHYKENMFPAMEMEGESFVLRPMNCREHILFVVIPVTGSFIKIYGTNTRCHNVKITKFALFRFDIIFKFLPYRVSFWKKHRKSASNQIVRHKQVHLFTNLSVITVFCFL
jgi:threonyl-tRNA synthetase